MTEAAKARVDLFADAYGHIKIVDMTEEMIFCVAQLHLQAFAGYMNSQMGETYIRAFIRWFVQHKDGVALVAIDNRNRIVGYVVGAPQDANQRRNKDLFWTAGVGLLLRPWLFFRKPFQSVLLKRLKVLLGVIPVHAPEATLPEPAMSLVGIAVSPHARGSHVAATLLQAFEARAREFRMRSLTLSVYPDNMAARRLYERSGWKPLAAVGQGEALGYFRNL